MANEHHHAVIVGINRYPGIKDLTNCVSDAEAFKNWLLDGEGGDLKPENVQTVYLDESSVNEPLTRSEAKPDKDTIFEAIHKAMGKGEATWAADPLDWTKTRFYFYVSGHGFAPRPREAALLMANSGPDWYGNNIGTGELADFLEERQSFKQVVIFADCCRERVVGAPVGSVPWTSAPADRGGVQVFGGLATTFGEFAFENDNPDELRSYFTKAVLEGLTGIDLKTGETEVTASQLEDYVNVRVPDLTEHKREPQRPDIRHQRSDDFVLATVQPVRRAGTNFLLNFPAGLNETVQLLDGNFAPITKQAPYDTSQGPWALNLTIGLYKVVKASDSSDLALAQSGIFQVTSVKRQHDFLL